MNRLLVVYQRRVLGVGFDTAEEEDAVGLDEGLHRRLPPRRRKVSVDGVKDPVLLVSRGMYLRARRVGLPL